MPELSEQIEPNPGDAGLPPPVSPDNGGAPEGGSPSPDVVAPPKSLRDTIIAARDEVRAKQGDDRPRDPATGKFAPKTGDATPKAAPAINGASPQAPMEAKPAEAVKPDLGGPPANWSADKKAAWSDLTSLQKAAVKREEEITNGISQYQQRQKELDAVVAPRRQHYASEGISDTEAINRLWTWFENLQTNPAQAFPALASVFGYDLNSVNPGNGGAQQTNPLDPRLYGEVNGVKSEVAQLRSIIQQQEQTRVAAELQAFGKDKPHFENPAVKQAMGRLMQAGLASSLDDAYQKATRIDPDVSARIAAEERAKSEADAAKAALARVPQTRTTPQRASVSPRSMSPNGVASPQAQPSGSVRESLQRAFAAARG